MARQVVSIEAQASQVECRRAMASLQLHLVGIRRRPLPRLEHRYGSDFEELALAGAFLRIVSAAENFGLACLLRSFESRAPVVQLHVGRLWDTTSVEFGMTWQRQCKAWNDLLGIEMEKAPAYKRLGPFLDVRNAITHGLGELTRRQLANNKGPAMRERLRRAGFVVVGNRIALQAENIADAISAVVDFIDWLDLEAQGAP
jgi:hypothetical protein